MNEKDLLKLKEKINQAKNRQSELRGRLDYLEGELKTKWKCKNVREAQRRLQEMDRDIKILEEEIAKGIEQIQEKYPDMEE